MSHAKLSYLYNKLSSLEQEEKDFESGKLKFDLSRYSHLALDINEVRSEIEDLEIQINKPRTYQRQGDFIVDVTDKEESKISGYIPLIILAVFILLALLSG